MRVSVYTSNRGQLDIENMDDASALDLLEAYRLGDERTLTLDMDGATVVVATAHVVRIDLEPPT